jgi:hypothetical protein
VGPALAAPVLELTGEIAPATAPALVLAVVNAGSDTAEAVQPEIVYQQRTSHAETATLQPGGRREWHLPLPPPRGPGTFPVLVRVHYASAAGTHATPLVVLLPASSPAAPAQVDASFRVERLAGAGRGALVLASSSSRRISGRAAFFLPQDLAPRPESQPLEIPPRGTATAPIVIDVASGVRDATYPAYAYFEYDEDGVHQTVVASTRVEVRGTSGLRALPLRIGLASLALALAVLAFAWSRAARRSRSATA